MLLKHFFTEKIAHSSYMLSGETACAVIDPQRDVNHYISEARDLGVKITHILQTHLHADFVSGHMDLAEKTGASIYVARDSNCSFDHIALSQGDSIELEDMILQVLETPGHSPGHLSFVVKDTSRTESPVGVFTGDTLFVGDVGRPDLFPDRSKELAGQLYESLHGKLLQLPDYCEIYPSHGAGSLCGRSMGSKWRSTIGYERNNNPALQITEKSAFIQSVTESMPPAPDHFSRCSDINRKGPVKLAELSLPEELSSKEFQTRMDDPDIAVLDSRSFLSFGGLHVPGSWHVDLDGDFPTYAGWVIPADKKILLVAEDYPRAMETVHWARRVGLDRIIGLLDGGMSSWAVSGLQASSVPQMTAKELFEIITGPEKIRLLDVRTTEEYEGGHIEGAIHIPFYELRTRHRELNQPELKTIVMCSTGIRSSIAASILKQNGFSKIINLAGGMTGYEAAGVPLEKESGHRKLSMK